MGGVFGSSNPEDVNSKFLAKLALEKSTGNKDHKDAIKAAFKAWDGDGNNTIEKDELKAVLQGLNANLSEKDIDKLFKVADKDGDSHISYDEMIEWIFRSPHLEHYFKEAVNLQKKAASAVKSHASKKPAADAAANKVETYRKNWDTLRASQKTRIEAKLKPLIEKAFQWHDKNDNDKLEVGESIEFFTNYVKCMMLSTPHALQYLTTFLCMEDVEKNEELNMENVSLLIEEKCKAFQKTAQDPDSGVCEAAFNVLLTGEEKMLTKEEVLAGLMPGTPKNVEFLKALGLFVTPEDALAAAAKPAPAAAEGADGAQAAENGAGPAAAGAVAAGAVAAGAVAAGAAAAAAADGADGGAAAPAAEGDAAAEPAADGDAAAEPAADGDAAAEPAAEGEAAAEPAAEGDAAAEPAAEGEAAAEPAAEGDAEPPADDGAAAEPAPADDAEPPAADAEPAPADDAGPPADEPAPDAEPAPADDAGPPADEPAPAAEPAAEEPPAE